MRMMMDSIEGRERTVMPRTASDVLIRVSKNCRDATYTHTHTHARRCTSNMSVLCIVMASI